MATQRTSVAKPPNVLYLSNLAYEASREALVEWFEEHGLRVVRWRWCMSYPHIRWATGTAVPNWHFGTAWCHEAMFPAAP